MSREKLQAKEGHILTNGVDYGVKIWLSENNLGDDYYEITKEEYNATMDSENFGDGETATTSDYQAALRELGVKI